MEQFLAFSFAPSISPALAASPASKLMVYGQIRRCTLAGRGHSVLVVECFDKAGGGAGGEQEERSMQEERTRLVNLFHSPTVDICHNIYILGQNYSFCAFPDWEYFQIEIGSVRCGAEKYCR